MRYLVYLVLMFGSFLAYLQLTKAYAKKVRQGYEPLEHEYDMCDDEIRKQEIIEELSKMETKAFTTNKVIRILYSLIPIALTVFLIAIPLIKPLSTDIEWLIEDFKSYGTTVGTIITIVFLIAIAFNAKAIYDFTNGTFSTESLTGISIAYQHTVHCFSPSRDIRNGENRSTTSALHCIYPDRFPLLKYDRMAAFYLGSIYGKNKRGL